MVDNGFKTVEDLCNGISHLSQCTDGVRRLEYLTILNRCVLENWLLAVDREDICFRNKNQIVVLGREALKR